MPPSRPNILFLFSDEHDPRHMGVSGSPLAHTPHMDALAARGTRFVNAYTPSPICVPARASLATGLDVHDVRCWDNALAYDGRVPGWGHVMQATRPPRRVDRQAALHQRNRRYRVWRPAPRHAHLGGDRPGLGLGARPVALPAPRPRHAEEHRPGLEQLQPVRHRRGRGGRGLAARAGRVAGREALVPVRRPGGAAFPPWWRRSRYFDRYPPDAIEPSKLLPADGHAHHPWIARREELRLRGNPLPRAGRNAAGWRSPATWRSRRSLTRRSARS